MRANLLLTLGLALAGCKVSLQDLEHRPSGREQKALGDAAATFAARVESGGQAAIAEELDLPARKALLIFGVSLAYEKDLELKKAVDQAIAGVLLWTVLLLLGDEPEPWTGLIRDTLERASQQIGAELQREFGVSGEHLLELSDRSGPLLERLAARQQESEPATRARLLGAISSSPHTGCHPRGRLVSLDLRLLRFTSWEHADRSRTFREWKQRAQALHLTEVDCAEDRAFVLFATEDDHEAPRVVLFRFLPVEQFERFKAKLLAWL